MEFQQLNIAQAIVEEENEDEEHAISPDKVTEQIKTEIQSSEECEKSNS